MADQESIQTQSYGFLAISLITLGLMPLIAFGSVTRITISEVQLQLVGLSFIAICILGIIAGIRPSSCKGRFQIEDASSDSSGVSGASEDSTESLLKRGHHYTCEPYSNHVVIIGNKVFCAGCTGLSIGAVIAIAGSLLFFFAEFRLENEFAFFVLGFVGVTIGLIQHSIYRISKVDYGYFRLFINVIFVVGAFLLLVSVIQITSDFAAALYLLIIIIFWIATRIIRSKSQHDTICKTCSTISCSSH